MTPTKWSGLIYNYFGLVLRGFKKIFQSFPEVNRLNLGSVSCFQQLLTQPLIDDQRFVLLQSRQGFLHAAPIRFPTSHSGSKNSREVNGFLFFGIHSFHCNFTWSMPFSLIWGGAHLNQALARSSAAIEGHGAYFEARVGRDF